MIWRLLGLVCFVLTGLAFGLALLMTFGMLLEYYWVEAFYAGLFWLLALALLILGLRLRQRRV